jgi:hypothetical protein
MDKPFDVTATVLMPDGSKTELAFNLFDVKREFPCPICSSIGDDEKISVQSWSDHFARHYVENNRAGEIDRAITEDMKTTTAVKGLRDDVAKYDRAVSGNAVSGYAVNGLTVNGHTLNGHTVNGHTLNADAYDQIIIRHHPHIPTHAYNTYGGDMSEEQMLQLAMEESLRESEAASELAKATAALAKYNAECQLIRIEEPTHTSAVTPAVTGAATPAVTGAVTGSVCTLIVDAVSTNVEPTGIPTAATPAAAVTVAPTAATVHTPAVTVPAAAATVPTSYPARKKKVS